MRNRLFAMARRFQRWAVPTILSLLSVTALAGAPRDRLTLLVPDGADLNSWQVKVWRDTAEEEGITLELITDSAFLALGASGPSRITGLIVPDSAHLRASDAVIEAIKQYTYLGGQTMLVYDAGVLDPAGFFPRSGNSRFADFVGVDYVFWNNGLGASTMVGFGPVVGTRGRLKSLSIPPGKYLPYVPPASLARMTFDTAFVPTSQFDPGGAVPMKELLAKRAKQAIDDGSSSVRKKRPTPLHTLLGIGIESSGQLRFAQRQPKASDARNKHLFDKASRSFEDVDAAIDADGSKTVERDPLSAEVLAADAKLHSISGYGYGPLGYFHYVTSGDFPGTVYLSSPEHGLVAGHRHYGSGQLLFVNMPLGYFKAIGTDGAPLHGFMGLFAREQVGISTVSVQPNGRGGLIHNWHVDDGDDLTINMKYLLDETEILEQGPFSFHFTAGPDVINFGDGNGMNLNGNRAARDLVNEIAGQKPDGKPHKKSKLADHAIGSHGGWIHDYWGATANEANAPNLTHLLAWNFDAIERTTGRPIREYSSPMGNTPLWAIRWLEQRGVVAMYLVADTGNGMTRSWRDGARVSKKLWTSPVTPLGKYATFEEFDDFGVSDAESNQWLVDLQSFVVNNRTNRMFYSHPPGTVDNLKPIQALLKRGESLAKSKRFSWYTMTELADFSQRRIETAWVTTTIGDAITFQASHPTSVANVTRLLPKRTFNKPSLDDKKDAKVTEDADNWIVTAERGTSLTFSATIR